MFEIKGKFATAICYASVCEDQAIQQIKTMCDMPFAEGSRIRIMPDVHAGAGCTIGTTVNTPRLKPGGVSIFARTNVITRRKALKIKEEHP